MQVTATPARHGPKGFEPISGDVIGFVLTLGDATGASIYISGDTGWYEGIADIGRRFPVKLAILLTGAARPRGAFHVTMDSNDAIEAASAFPEATFVSVHNEGWEHFSESQEDLAHSFAALGLASRLIRLERGIPLKLTL